MLEPSFTRTKISQRSRLAAATAATSVSAPTLVDIVASMPNHTCSPRPCSLPQVLALPGEVILQQGQVGIGLFYIIRGVVEVLRRDVGGSGEGTFLSDLRAHQFFGERSLLSERPAAASCVARVFTDLMLFEKEDVRRVLREFPDVISQIFYFASRRAATPASRSKGRGSVADFLRRASQGRLSCGAGLADGRLSRRSCSVRADPTSAAAAAAAATSRTSRGVAAGAAGAPAPSPPGALQRQNTLQRLASRSRRSSLARLRTSALASIGRSRAVCGSCDGALSAGADADEAPSAGASAEAESPMANFNAAEVLNLGVNESNLDADDVRATAMLIASGNLMHLSGEALKLQQKAAHALRTGASATGSVRLTARPSMAGSGDAGISSRSGMPHESCSA